MENEIEFIKLSDLDGKLTLAHNVPVMWFPLLF